MKNGLSEKLATFGTQVKEKQKQKYYVSDTTVRKQAQIVLWTQGSSLSVDIQLSVYHMCTKCQP